MNEQVEFATMSDRARYLFDLQGFLVVKGMLSATEVKILNEALEANLYNRENFGEANAISGN